MRAVFHHSNDDPELHERLLSNVANLIEDGTIPLERVALVTNSGGLDLVVTDSEYRDRVQSLMDDGVDFKQCKNTLQDAGLDEDDLIEGIEIVSSGVGELTRLQSEGYAYLRP